LLDARRDIDAQSLRQLVRNAGREAAAGKPPASARKLFRLLRDSDERDALPPLP
jgi:ribosome-associated protein